MSNNGLTTLMPNNGKRPTVTLGVMTAKLLHRFEHFACGYLMNRENLKSSDYVAHIAYAFEDPLFSDWFQTSHSYYEGLSFNEFMTKIHAHWLAAGWEKELAQKICNTKQSLMAFCDFSTTIRHDNLLLKNTKYHLSPPQLCTKIELNLSHDLLSAYDQYKEKHNSDSKSDDENMIPEDGDIAATAKALVCKAEQHLESFVQLLIKLDDKVHEESASHQKEAEDTFRKLKRSGSNAGLSDHACQAPNVCSQQQTTAQTSSSSTKGNTATVSSSATSQGRPPKLTE
ncbi:hypothetical protein L208DRAFT_1263755 [Tricholoma matsutake]|nr:hypothetical protein L208DRAFT_1263755 [Tricholoma matsutake 945]